MRYFCQKIVQHRCVIEKTYLGTLKNVRYNKAHVGNFFSYMFLIYCIH